MKKIRVLLPDNPYDVLIGSNIINSLPTEIAKRKLPQKFFAVIDSNVYKKYRDIVDYLFGDIPGHRFKFSSSEKDKSYDTLHSIHEKMLSAGMSRDSIIVALGGGIVGDVTGFSASTFMRGIKYIQVPTTLLAAVDSSVGGKTGINFNNTKNIIGTFYQPDLVLIDTDFFKTLPFEEILCGTGEIIKYAFITNAKFYNYINKNLDAILKLDSKVIQYVVSESVKYKGDVVISDEKEAGLRKVLNFGHTFAHAIEVEQDYKIKHGQAVIVGIACALFLSNKKGLLANTDLEKYLELLIRFSKHIKISAANKSKLYSIMQRDKKNRMGKIKFVLLKTIGEMVIDVEAGKEDVYYALQKGLELFQNK